jgi:predicted helicase
MTYQLPAIFGLGHSNTVIGFLGVASNNPLAVLAVESVFDLCLLKMGNGGTQGVPRWRFANDGSRIDNVTNWALEQFQKQYAPVKKESRPISKNCDIQLRVWRNV